MTSLRSLRVLLAPAFFASSVLGAGCAPTDSGDAADTQKDAVTAIANTPVKEQFIGTCWLYTTAAWAEALHLRATGKALNLSESYWTYWMFYDRITQGQVGPSGELEETGSWGIAADIIERYGLMLEGDFIPEEATSPTSDRTTDAMNAIMTSLVAGKLTTPQARKDRALVRAELDVAFGLRPEAVGWLDATFGKDGRRVFVAGGGVIPAGALITRARDFVVAGPPAAAGRALSLTDVIGRKLPESNLNRRAGADTWQWAMYPKPDAGASRRRLLQRVQRSLNDGLPVVVAWNVDHKAVNATGELRAPSGTRGTLESHLSLITDYQASAVPGFGVLPVGQTESRAEALAAALNEAAVVDLLRIKNSWGAKARDTSAVPAGYHDIFRGYYDASLDTCDAAGCRTAQALGYVILPAGY